MQTHHYWLNWLTIDSVINSNHEETQLRNELKFQNLNTEQLRAKLVKTGYDQDEIFEMDHSDLLNSYAEYLFTYTPVTWDTRESRRRSSRWQCGTSAEEWV